MIWRFLTKKLRLENGANVDDRKDGAKNKDVVSKDLKRKGPSATKQTKKAVSTPQQNSNSRSA